MRKWKKRGKEWESERKRWRKYRLNDGKYRRVTESVVLALIQFHCNQKHSSSYRKIFKFFNTMNNRISLLSQLKWIFLKIWILNLQFYWSPNQFFGSAMKVSGFSSLMETLIPLECMFIENSVSLLLEVFKLTWRILPDFILASYV